MTIAANCHRAFVDTNVLLYAIGRDPKATQAELALEKAQVISVQVLNEFANTARRKLRWNAAQIREAESRFKELYEIVPLTVKLHGDALRISDRYGFSIYDSLVVAAALETGCTELYTEDLQAGQRIDDVLEVVNPFD